MRIKLEERVTKEQTVEIQIRPELHALKCDACGIVFMMKKFSPNDRGLAEMHGTFESAVVHRGNGFVAHVCSFRCAHDLLTGGWRKMPEYKTFAENDIKLARAELKITSTIVTEDKLRERWQAINQTKRPDSFWYQVAIDHDLSE